MKLSCLPVSFFDDIISGRMTLAAWAAMGKRLGLDAIDTSILFTPDRSTAAIAEARRQIEGEGMRVTMVTSYPDFTHPDPAQRLREVELEREVVDVARGLGARYVRVTAGQAHPGVGRTEGVAWAIEGLTRLAQQTTGSGVTLVYENHAKPGAWTYTDFSQPPELFLAIAGAVKSSGIRVNFDFGNATAFAADPVALLGQVIDSVESVHASDTSTRGALAHVLLGTGLTPYAALFARLKAAHWDGWVCMEEASRGGEKGVADAAKFVRDTWKVA